ncbi:hypothetical protein AB0C33_19400 [Nonomuraea sp. NPDC048881]|uniref:hypothetical protein n=1 Tax=Nonomuraea sp. NPDC048881 TaxID=3155030 RepID=UPI0033D6169E
MSGTGPPVVHTEQLDVYVADCGVIYLLDEEGYDAPGVPEDSIGLVQVEAAGVVCLHIAAQAGEVPFTVAVADRDPGARLDGYEDVVEISFETVASELVVVGWATDWREDKAHRLPLPAGPGAYRLRYHTQGDDENWEEDGYYLQIWPAPRQDPAVLKTTSQFLPYLLDPEGWKPQ